MDEFYAEAVNYGQIDTSGFNRRACGLKSRGTQHTVQVQMMPAYSGDAAVAGKRTLLIEYSKYRESIDRRITHCDDHKEMV